MSWLVPRDSMTSDQVRAVEFDTKAHHLVLGSPGSGKTNVALHRTQYLSRQQQVPPWRYRIFVYTNTLKAYIKSGIDDLGLSHECVSTFDQWCREYYRKHLGRDIPRIDNGPDFQKIRWQIRRHLSGKESRVFDFVIVDEGQDLDVVAFEILTSIAVHLTVFMDGKQQIFESGSTLNDILRSLGIDNNDMQLLGAFRCTPYIVRMAASFIPDETERTRFQEETRDRIPRLKPLVYISNQHENLINHLIEVLQTRVDMGERTGVLFPSRKRVMGIGKLLEKAGFEVEYPRKAGSWHNQKQSGHDFASIRPKLMAYPSAKGLTFDSVLLPFFNRDEFRHSLSEPVLERWLFVAMTRATQWIYINGKESLIQENRLLELENQSQLTVRRDSGPSAEEKNEQTAEEETEQASAAQDDPSDWF